jgi:acyl dehydratase
VGESLESLTFTVTPRFNEQILESIGCQNLTRYRDIVHPSILVGMSNLTRSPSYHLDEGVDAMHTHDEIEFLRWVYVGETLTTNWVVEEIYHRRNKNWNDIIYQVMSIVVLNANNQEVIRRRMTDVYLRKDL